MEKKIINKTLKFIEFKLKNENFGITIEELQKLGIETINNSIKIGKNVGIAPDTEIYYFHPHLI